MTLPKSKFEEVIDTVPEEFRGDVSCRAIFIWNTQGGRPSSAAARAVAEFNRLGSTAFNKRQEEEHNAVLASCCDACRETLARKVSKT